MEVCYWALFLMPLVILHHLLNVSVQLTNKGGLKKSTSVLLLLGAGCCSLSSPSVVLVWKGPWVHGCCGVRLHWSDWFGPTAASGGYLGLQVLLLVFLLLFYATKTFCSNWNAVSCNTSFLWLPCVSLDTLHGEEPSCQTSRDLLHLTQMWLSFCQLQHCLRSVWKLAASIAMMTLKRTMHEMIARDFYERRMAARKRLTWLNSLLDPQISADWSSFLYSDDAEAQRL
jgi:hypothetical protein